MSNPGLKKWPGSGLISLRWPFFPQPFLTMLFAWASSSFWSHSPGLSWVEHRDQGDHVLGFCPRSNARKHSPCCEVREAMGKKATEGRSEAVDSLFGLGPWPSDQKSQNAWKICLSYLVSKQEEKTELGPAGECSCCLSSIAFNTLKARSHGASTILSTSPNLILNNGEPSFTWLYSKSCFVFVLGSILGVTFYVSGTLYILPHFIFTNTINMGIIFPTAHFTDAATDQK